MNFAKFLRSFLKSTSGRLILNLSLRCWFSEAAAHRCFSKQVFLKTLQYWRLFLIIKLLLQNTYAGYFWIFVAANIFLELNMVFIADNRTGSEAATRGVLLRKGVLSSFAKLTGKHKCQSFLFNEVAGLRLATLLKKRLWHRRFPVNFAKFPRTPYRTTTDDCFCRFLFWTLLKTWVKPQK